MTDCLFCKIAEGKLQTDFLYQDEKIVAFKDIHPQAPEHVLVIPKQHIATLNDVDEPELLGSLLCVAKQLANKLGISTSGYRTVINCNSDGGQEVYHLHLHLLGGKQMSW